MDKIAGLREILAQDPNNAFARYGLAVELAENGDTESAIAEFDQLLASHPAYTSGYFMCAQTLAKAGRTDEAMTRLKSGIESAKRDGNSHAMSNMQAFLDELER
jgi:cytochrome c-type biogenesis protein CcmH/NrfG